MTTVARIRRAILLRRASPLHRIASIKVSHRTPSTSSRSIRRPKTNASARLRERMMHSFPTCGVRIPFSARPPKSKTPSEIPPPVRPYPGIS
jgi:hypothetical protein